MVCPVSQVDFSDLLQGHYTFSTQYAKDGNHRVANSHGARLPRSLALPDLFGKAKLSRSTSAFYSRDSA